MFLRIIFLYVVYSLAAIPAAAEIVSFKNDFHKFVETTNHKSTSDQVKLWDNLIERPHQEFYDSTVWEKSIRPNWSELKNRLLPSRLDFDKKNAAQIFKAFDDFPERAQRHIEIVKKIVPAFEVHFQIYAILAPNFDAKSVVIGVSWLAQKFISDMKQKTLNPTPTETFKSWFSVGNLKPRADLPNRSGYFLGLMVVREVAKFHSLNEMINWKPTEIEKPIFEALSALKK